MIEYWKGPYSLNLFFYLHGSTLYASLLPGILSCIIYYYFFSTSNEKILVSATIINTLVTSASFAIVYRVKFCYDRYWDACRDVHIMMGKWLDATASTACFHMQSLKTMQPRVCISKHPNLFDSNVYMDRQVLNLSGIHIAKEFDDESSCSTVPLYTEDNWIINKDNMLDGGWHLLNNDGPTSSWKDSKKTPFLQELAHLSSLCVAVAFNTFRDIDGKTSNFGKYELNQPWPVTNPYHLDNKESLGSLFLRYVRYFFGFSRSSDSRMRYSTERKLNVIGGVSENELIALSKARGPSAKVTLVWFWLSEFVTREQLAGSLGKVDPPIVSRIHQFLSDGMKFYNDARQIVYIPFPFVHDQLSTVIVAPLILFIPLMVVEYTKTFWVGLSLTFFIITCINGFLEVARELENPFRNFPNDIPLCTLLAMYNESLIAMCAGFHPDHYWNTENPKEKVEKNKIDEIDDIIASL